MAHVYGAALRQASSAGGRAWRDVLVPWGAAYPHGPPNKHTHGKLLATHPQWLQASVCWRWGLLLVSPPMGRWPAVGRGEAGQQWAADWPNGNAHPMACSAITCCLIRRLLLCCFHHHGEGVHCAEGA
jgi:hypothetical protein